LLFVFRITGGKGKKKNETPRILSIIFDEIERNSSIPLRKSLNLLSLQNNSNMNYF
jgi:hypothetical protein